MADQKRKTVIFVANRKAARSIARHKGKLIGVKKMNAVEASKNKQRHNRWGTKKSTHRKPSDNKPMSWFANNWREMAEKNVEHLYVQHRRAPFFISHL